jgi:UDP-N-acetylmuramate dehydrogenase
MSTQAHHTSIQEHVSLAPLTTIGLGGTARYFTTCHTTDELLGALKYAQDRNLKTHILGGGSNTIFSDDGFDGLVIHISLKGIEFQDTGNHALAVAQAGEGWDAFVVQCIERGLAGVECLSGIPGFVGATPIQNVGAYGQEVAQTIEYVDALDTHTLQRVRFSNKECEFEYRRSRFKYQDNGRYVITAVAYRLQHNGSPTTRYPEVQKAVKGISQLPPGKEQLLALRDVVLSLRKRKSMVIDNNDPHSRSCGSFFVNPVISSEQFSALQQIADTDIPHFAVGKSIKVPAAWLIEHAGFTKGYRKGGVGISQNHTLALVNYGGTAKELLTLAEDIHRAVKTTFGIELKQEPVVIT